MGDPVGQYRGERKNFFYRHEGRWPGTLSDPFDILAPVVLTRSEANEILECATGLARLYRACSELLHRLSDEALLQIGVPVWLLPFVRCSLPGSPDSLIGRFDLTRTGSGYKMLEFNADVVGLLVETFSINAQVCRDCGREDPNEGGEARLRRALSEAVSAGAKYVKIARDCAHVVVTSVGTFVRDRATSKYLAEVIEADYEPIESISLDQAGLYAADGRRIDVLVRGYPLRFIRNEVFQARGLPLEPEMGGAALQLVRQGRLAMINPPSASLLESKALQVVIWNLYESGRYFTSEERQLIERYMLPAYLDPLRDNALCVRKPAYGAGGDMAEIIDGSGGAGFGLTAGETTVYQSYSPLPVRELMTEDGPRRLHVVTLCFQLAGTAMGICLRAGDLVTDSSAWYLPVCF